MTSKYQHLNLKLGRHTGQKNMDAVPRVLSREGLSDRTFPHGYDLWNIWEAGFIQPNGIPKSFILQLAYPSDSPFLVESKSLKLYMNHLGTQTFSSPSDFLRKIKEDLEACVQAPVQLAPVYDGAFLNPILMQGICLEEESDRITIQEEPQANRIIWDSCEDEFNAFTRCFQSNCPITGQPDFGNILIEMQGDLQPRIESLLAYLMAFRNIQEFHETCCERIFSDLIVHGQPSSLKVSCFFTRRGGIDINPVRALHSIHPAWGNLYWRQ